MKSWTPPTNEMIEKVLSSVKKETDRQYFFSKLSNPLWVQPLRERGYFKNPPAGQQLPGGYVQYPYWPELAYLVTVAGDATQQVIDIVLALPRTDNPHVYDNILAIALKLEGQESARLLPKLVEYTELDNQFLAYRYPELLQHWLTQGNIDAALEIIKKLVFFREDPKARKKQQRRMKNHNSSDTLLEPAPRIHGWEYQQILEKGVRPLAAHESCQIACILIDAVANMIRLGMHREDFDKGRDKDYSEIWCPHLDKSDRGHPDVQEALVHTLTYACEQVYHKDLASIDALDQALRKQRWHVFNRLRQHLYACNLTDQTLPWIRELILGHDEYSEWEYHYEFQLMIRRASEHFGPGLLSEEEQTAIFDAIRSGPPNEDLRERMGEQYSEEAFQQRRRYFHRMQLRPFAALLNGEIQRYFEELAGEKQAKPVTDDSYLPFKMLAGGAVISQSPKSAEELERFTDDEILAYLNDWNDEHHDKDNWLIEINISALAGVFQTLFKERIIPDETRLAFWMAHRDDIARPVYAAAMLKVMQELVREKNFGNLGQWIEFCAWVLSHPDPDRAEGQPMPQHKSRDYPDWGSSRRAVVDFIDACVNKGTDAPVTARDGLAYLLRQVCTQFDWQLDHSRPVLLNRDDPITEAINNTRSRALESLVNFGFWVRRYLPDDPVPEVTDILSARMDKGGEIPFTMPEQGLMGMHFWRLCTLNRDWAAERKGFLFPQENEPFWRDAFGSFIRSTPPRKLMFDILRGDFEYALEHLNILTAAKDDGKELVDSLGRHLLYYYLWQVYPLMGDESLLACFYEKTGDDRERWAQLFDHLGRSLRNSGKHLDKELTTRVIAYFDWRFEAAEPIELQEFTFWLEAECLNPEWRLRSYSKILDLGGKRDDGLFTEVRALNKLLSGHLALVVECFVKITDHISQGAHMHLPTDEASHILKAGLNADDPQVRNNAERARENLLQVGRFDFLEIG